METYIHELDETDLQILRILQANSRLTTKELAQQILSASAVWREWATSKDMWPCSTPTRWSVALWCSATFP